ncbi:MAG TPA: hypothetical protein VHD87_15625 [Acidimicrobiales bacterium]|nr:hypothetical protein [Acidimicrobiales bacterium]
MRGRCGFPTATGKCRNKTPKGFARCYLHQKASAPLAPAQVAAIRAAGGPGAPMVASPPKSFAHPNKAVAEPGAPRKRLPKMERVVVVDLDGTVFDSWACCGHGKAGFSASEDCDHLRQDTMASIRKLCAEQKAQPVIVSWRAGLYDKSKAWLDKVGLKPAAIFIPGAPHDIAHEAPEEMDYKKHTKGQVQFKAATITALQARGVAIVGAFDDNEHVAKAYSELGIPAVTRVQRLVDIEPHEWSAGYIGAPKPKPAMSYTSRYLPAPKRDYSAEASLFDDAALDDYESLTQADLDWYDRYVANGHSF